MQNAQGRFARFPSEDHPDQEVRKSLSPIAVLVIDGVISAAMALGGRAAGFGWGSAFIFGWAGGAVVTIALLSAGVLLRERVDARREARHGTLYDSWDQDRARDQADARRHRRDTDAA
ncbi:MAG: hypothetical protein ACK5IB_07665 [Qingshengfaniella sp.]